MADKILIGGLHDAQILFSEKVLGEDVDVTGVKGVITELVFDIDHPMTAFNTLENGIVHHEAIETVRYVTVKLAISSFLTSEYQGGATKKEINPESKEGQKIMRDLQLDF